jgi:hypothetical protein
MLTLWLFAPVNVLPSFESPMLSIDEVQVVVTLLPDCVHVPMLPFDARLVPSAA